MAIRATTPDLSLSIWSTLGQPSYSATTQYQSDSKPEYLETQYIANSYQMGSLTGGTSVDGGDVNGFKILAFDETDDAVDEARRQGPQSIS